MFNRYQDLVRSLCVAMTVTARAEVENNLASIRAHVLTGTSSGLATGLSCGNSESPSGGNSILASLSDSSLELGSSQNKRHPPRYLGEVSDIQFFNLAKRTLRHDGSGPDHGDDAVDSYDQEESILTEAAPSLLLSPLEYSEAREHLDAYFSTIHIVYPFVSRSAFLQRFAILRKDGVTKEVNRSWVSLLCKVSNETSYTSL
jgi:hypothetical protein